MLEGLVPAAERPTVAALLVKLAQLYRDVDAELIEINPLAVVGDGDLVALDCKLVLDDSAVKRREGLAATGTERERP